MGPAESKVPGERCRNAAEVGAVRSGGDEFLDPNFDDEKGRGSLLLAEISRSEESRDGEALAD